MNELRAPALIGADFLQLWLPAGMICPRNGAH